MKATNADNQREGDNFGGDEKLFASGSCQADDRKNDECKHSEMEKQGGSNDAGFIPNRRRQRRRCFSLQFLTFYSESIRFFFFLPSNQPASISIYLWKEVAGKTNYLIRNQIQHHFL